MNIADNLQFMETHYIKIWLKKWQHQLDEGEVENERAKLEEYIQKAKQELSKREQ